MNNTGGARIDAIKELRHRTHCTLTQAVQWLDNYVSEHGGTYGQACDARTVSLPNPLERADVFYHRDQAWLPRDLVMAEVNALIRQLEETQRQLEQANAQNDALSFARERAEKALRQIKRYTKDVYILACISEGLGGPNG